MQTDYANHEAMLKNQIRASAIICMKIKGVDKTRIGDIANELGIARQTIYNYFNNKNALFDAMFMREAVSLAESIATHIRPINNLEDKFTQAFLFAIDEFPKHTVLAHVITSGGQYMQEIGISRETMQVFGELVLVDIFNAQPFLKAQSLEISELMSRNILSFLSMPDKNSRSHAELETYFRRRILPGIGLSQY